MNIVKSLLCGVTLLGFASCVQSLQESETELPCSPLERVTVTAGPITPFTRVISEQENNVMHFYWERGDAILLANTQQQIPYLATSAGASTHFVSALFGSANRRDYITEVGDNGAIYAYYPYVQGEKIDMEKKTVRINPDEPFFYAIDTIQNGVLNLHFHHVFAYLKFNLIVDDLEEIWAMHCHISPGSPITMVRDALFNFDTKQIEGTNFSDGLWFGTHQLANKDLLYPIMPVSQGKTMLFTLCYDDDQIEYEVPMPEGGFKAGHVYQIYLPISRTRQFLMEIFEETNGHQWKNNTNWKSDAPIGEWYGVTTDAEGHVVAIDLSDNNLSGDLSPSLHIPYLKQLNVDKNNLTSLYLSNFENLNNFTLKECVIEDFSTDVDSVQVSECTISRKFGYSSSHWHNLCSLTNCSIQEAYVWSVNNLSITGGSCAYLHGEVRNQLTIKDATIGLKLASGDLRIADDADVVLENVTLKDVDGNYSPVTLTRSFKGSELNALLEQIFGSQSTR